MVQDVHLGSSKLDLGSHLRSAPRGRLARTSTPWSAYHKPSRNSPEQMAAARDPTFGNVQFHPQSISARVDAPLRFRTGSLRNPG